MIQANFFYIVGGNVPADALSYVTRDADALLLQRLLQREFCYILTTRQMGKSSLMTHMVKRLREHHVAPAVLDLSSQGFSLSAEQWYNGLLDQLSRRLKLGDEMEEFCLQHASLSPLQLWQKALREVVLEAIPGQVTIFIDEVDVVRSLPFSTDEFFAAIRACYNARTEDAAFARLNFCLLGVATPANLISNPRLTPFNIGTRVELTDFSREEAQALEHGLGQDTATNRLLMDRVYYWTAGHPYLTQRLCQEIAASDANLTDGSVDACAERLFLSSKAQRQDSNLTFVHQRMLPFEEEQRIGMLTLYGRILSGKAVADSDTAAFVSDLKLAGIVRAEKGQLKVRNRIYAHVFSANWINENMPGMELRRQRAAYRQGMFQAGALAAVVLLMIGAMAFAVVSQAKRADKFAKKEHLARIDADNNAALAERRRQEAELSAKKAKAAASIAQTQSALAEKRRLEADLSTKQARTAASIAQTQSALAERRRLDAERTSYIVNMNMIQREWDANNLGHVLELLEETRKSQFRGFEWGYWNRMCHRDLLTIHTGKNGNAVAFSPDGKRIVTGGYDNTAKGYNFTAKIWDAATGHKVLSLNGHTGSIACVAYSPDGKRIVTGSYATAKVWDAVSGRELLTFKGHTADVTSVAFSPDGQRIVTGSSDKTVKVWDAATGRQIVTVAGSENIVTPVGFSPDGRRIVTGSDRRHVKVWDAVTGRDMLTINVGVEQVISQLNCVCFSPDGTRILTGTNGSREFSMGDHSGLDDVSSAENYARGKDATAKVWDSVTGREILALKGCTASVYAVAFSPDGRNILVGVGDYERPGEAKVWDAQTGQETMTYRGHLKGITAVAFSPDGTRFVTASEDNTAKVWDAWTTRRALALNIQHASSVVFSPDGKRILTGSRDLGSSGDAKVWDAHSGQEILALKLEGPVGPVAYSPDGRYIVTGSGQYVHYGNAPDPYQAAATVWNAQTGNKILALNVAKKADVTAIAFSPDSRGIVTAGGEAVNIWDTQTGKVLLALKVKPGYIRVAAFSPDGKRIVTGGYDGTAKLWDAATGREILTLTGHKGSISSIAFSPDGQRIVTGSDDKTATVWDARKGQEILTLRGHTLPIHVVAFSPDGQRIATGSADGMTPLDGEAKLWDAQTGRETLTLQGNATSVNSLAFSPDGKNIVTVGVFHAYMWFSDPKGWKDAMSTTIATKAQADAHVERGQELVNVNKYSEAVAEYKLALRLRPALGSASFLGSLGWYEYLAGQIDDAIKSSRSALEKDSNLNYVKLNLGLSYATLEDWPKAKQEYDLALKTASKTEVKAGIEDVQTAIKKRSNPALQQALVYLQKAGGK